MCSQDAQLSQSALIRTSNAVVYLQCLQHTCKVIGSAAASGLEPRAKPSTAASLTMARPLARMRCDQWMWLTLSICSSRRLVCPIYAAAGRSMLVLRLA